MARFAWPFRAPTGLSAGANRGAFALTCAAISLALSLPTVLTPVPAAGQETDRRFSFTGTFRYEPVRAPAISALHLPPEAVPIPVASQSRRNATLLTPLPNVAPRALLGTRANEPAQPFATDNRSTLGRSDPATNAAAIPKTLPELPPGIERSARPNDPRARDGDDGTRSAALTEDQPGTGVMRDRAPSGLQPDEASAPATIEDSASTVQPDRSRTNPSQPGRASTARGAVTASGAPQTNSILAPTPPWAERAFSGNN